MLLLPSKPPGGARVGESFYTLRSLPGNKRKLVTGRVAVLLQALRTSNRNPQANPERGIADSLKIGCRGACLTKLRHALPFRSRLNDLHANLPVFFGFHRIPCPPAGTNFGF